MDWSKSSKANGNDWRSITPEREFGPIVQAKQLVTEPAENKQTGKSMSQENDSNKTSINRLLANYDHQSQKFQKPLTHMKSSIKKLSEIGQQINSIISQCKQHSITRISRPQSDQQMYEKHSMIKKSSQHDISMSTNLNQNHSFLDNRGTETERSYLYNNKIQSGGLKYQKKNYEKQSGNSLKQLIQKKNGPKQQVEIQQKILSHQHQHQHHNYNSNGNIINAMNNDLFAEHIKLIQKKGSDRSQNIQKYLNLKFLRNSSGVWSSEKSENNKRMSSYYTQNHYSKSQSSFLMERERENSKSENTTSRNNRIRVSSYIKTPTKNNQEMIRQLSPRFISQQLSSYQVSSSKINSLLSSMNKDLDKVSQPAALTSLQIYHLTTTPLFMQHDPNQTHVIVCCSDYSVRAINLYSGRIGLLGKHQRPMRSISKVIIQQHCKIFYTGSQDGQIQQWVSESMHGPYKQALSWRMTECPLQLYQTEKGILYILTPNNLYYYSAVSKNKIELHGNVKSLLQTPKHILIAINDIIFKLQSDRLVQLIKLEKQIKNMIYEEDKIFVLTQGGSVVVLEDSARLCYQDEMECDAFQIYNMHSGQIVVQNNNNDLLIYNNQLKKQYLPSGKITCLLSLSQVLLVGSKKIIETIKL